VSTSLRIPLAKQPASIWPGGRPPTYARRRPELTTLHKVVRENLATLYAATEAGFDGTPLPRFVRQELDGYVGCGSLKRGFAHLRCEGCSDSRLVAFSCHGRGFCPSCFGRRMAQTSANLLDHVLPANVPLRQWVVTLPHALRARLAFDGHLLGAVVRLFADTVLGWYRRRMEIAGAPGGRGGAITVVQRVSSDLRCNPHVHGIFVDGVFVPAGGKPKVPSLATPCRSYRTPPSPMSSRFPAPGYSSF
jgi:Transposase zinc-binding domain/Putative transposase